MLALREQLHQGKDFRKQNTSTLEGKEKGPIEKEKNYALEG